MEILRRALDDLDGAAVCTLHSFAQRILREHTTEAGLPPRLEMLDEIGADMEFAEGWERFVEEVLAASGDGAGAGAGRCPGDAGGEPAGRGPSVWPTTGIWPPSASVRSTSYPRCHRWSSPI